MIVSEKRPEMSRIRLMIMADLRSLVDKAVDIGHITLDGRTKIACSGEKVESTPLFHRNY